MCVEGLIRGRNQRLLRKTRRILVRGVVKIRAEKSATRNRGYQLTATGVGRVTANRMRFCIPQ